MGESGEERECEEERREEQVEDTVCWAVHDLSGAELG
jgi:hypothetical protein